jgi:hypothetical protein
LGERALRGVDQQQHAVDHLQAAFHFAAEVRVTGRVDDVDRDIAAVAGLVLYGSVLREDRDALLALERKGVEYPLLHLLPDPERTRLPQHRVDQGRLAMVDVSDDSDVAQVGSGRHDRTFTRARANSVSLTATSKMRDSG